MSKLAEVPGFPYTASELYRWNKSKRGPGFEATLDLLERAGLLRRDARTADPRVDLLRRSLEAVQAELEQILRLLPANGEAPPGTHEAR